MDTLPNPNRHFTNRRPLSTRDLVAMNAPVEDDARISPGDSKEYHERLARTQYEYADAFLRIGIETLPAKDYNTIRSEARKEVHLPDELSCRGNALMDETGQADLTSIWISDKLNEAGQLLAAFRAGIEQGIRNAQKTPPIAPTDKDDIGYL